MPTYPRPTWIQLAFIGLALVACAGQPSASSPPAPFVSPADWLAVWSGTADTAHRTAFLSMVDLRDGSPTAGQVVAVLSGGPESRGTHHTEHALAPDGLLFADDFGTGRTYIFDLNEPATPKLHATFTTAGPFGWPHSYVRLPSGNRLVTYQWQSSAFNRPPGGIAEIRADGSVVRWANARSQGAADNEITPYSLEVLPSLDRAVTTSTSMIDSTGVHVQVWRLSDLALLHTVRIPATRPPAHSHDMSMMDSMPRHLFPGEPRVLADGHTIMLATFSCGLYTVTGIETDTPVVHPVYAFPGADCAIPIRAGRYWLQTVPELHAVVTLDVSDPDSPREVSRLTFDSSVSPHWLSADRSGKRIVMDTGSKDNSRVYLLRFDPETGALSRDPKIPVIDLAAVNVPGFGTVKAVPHGAVWR